MGLETETDPLLRAQGWVLCTEAAEKTGKVVQTLYRWIDQGKVNGCVVDGYRRYIDWNDLLDFLGPAKTSALGLKKIRKR